MPIRGVYVVLVPSLGVGVGYFGSSANIFRRWKEHVSKLSDRVHTSSAFQAAFDQCGASGLYFRVLRFMPGATNAEMEAAEASAIAAYAARYGAAAILNTSKNPVDARGRWPRTKGSPWVEVPDKPIGSQ